MKRSNKVGLYLAMRIQLIGIFSLFTTTTAVAAPTTPTPPVLVGCGVDTLPEPARCRTGWYISSYPKSDSITYRTKFPDNCYLDENDIQQCYFDDDATACAAAVVMNNDIEKYGTKWELVAIEVSDGLSKCKMKVKGGTTIQDLPVWFNANRPARGEALRYSFPKFGGGTTALSVKVSGPYRDQPDPPFEYGGTSYSGPQRGFAYTSCPKVTSSSGAQFDLRTMIVGINEAKHNNAIKSDLAGYAFENKTSAACVQPHPSKEGWCIEPTFLKKDKIDWRIQAQVHHMVPENYAGCRWGKNSMKNAAIISAQLNGHFSNNYPSLNAVLQVNGLASYPTFPL